MIKAQIIKNIIAFTMVTFLNSKAPLTQTQDSTPASILPAPQVVKQNYSDFVQKLPDPAPTGIAELTPQGLTNDQGVVENPVDNPETPVKQAQNTPNQPDLSVDNSQNGFQQAMKKYDMSSYNTANPQYFKVLGQIYGSMPDFSDLKGVDNYISSKFKGSKINAAMINSAANAAKVDPRLLASITQYESHFGLSPRAQKYFNATGYGALDSGSTRGYKNFQENLNHTALHLARLAN